jgi:hypothetical protein
LIQHAGFLLYSKFRDGQRFDLGFNLEAFANEFFTRTRNFFKNSWELCNDEEKTLLMLLALDGLKGRLNTQYYHVDDLATLFSRKERKMIYLEERGMLKSTILNGKKQYTFASSLTERWVIQELQDSNEQTLQERQKVWLGLISRKQSEQVTVAIRWLWHNKDKVPSILKWFGKIASEIPSGGIE